MWQIVAQISSGFALAAFLIAGIVTVLGRRSREKAELIRTASEADRARLVQDALEFFHVKTEDLSPREQYQLALEQIRARQVRFKQVTASVCLIALFATSLAAYAISRFNPSESTSTTEPATANRNETASLPTAAQESRRTVPPAVGTVQVSGDERVAERHYEAFETDIDLRGYGPQRRIALPGEGWEFDLAREVGTRQTAGQAGTCYGVDLPGSTSRGIVVLANNSSTRAGFPPERREGWVRCRLSAQRFRTSTLDRSFELPERTLEWTRPLYIDLPPTRTSFIARVVLFDGSEVAVAGSEVHRYFESSLVGNRLIFEPTPPISAE
jgi:hypothetical protein